MLEHDTDEVLLVTEVILGGRGVARTCRCTDLAQRHGVEAPLAEQALRSRDELSTRRTASSVGPSGVPVVFLHYLTAVLDDWDPRVIDRIAARRVIAFDNRGVGASGSSVPHTSTSKETARH